MFKRKFQQVSDRDEMRLSKIGVVEEASWTVFNENCQPILEPRGEMQEKNYEKMGRSRR